MAWTGRMTSTDAKQIRPLPECRTDGLAMLRRPVWVLDTGSMRKHFANEAALQLWCVEPGEEAEFYTRDFTPHSEAMRQRLGDLIERISQGEIVTECWTFYPRPRPFTIDALMSGVRLANGHVGLLMEVQQGTSSTDELRAAEALRHTVINVVLFDASGRAVYSNPAAQRCFPGDRRNFHSMFADEEQGAELWHTILGQDEPLTDAFMGRTVSGDFQLSTAQGTRWYSIDARTTADPVTGSLSVLMNQRDVTDRVEAASRAEFFAGYDAVTRLANRHRFVERFERLMGDPESRGALLTLDLNDFKEVNDNYGHAVGDAVLREIGERLRRATRPEDICARLGGDEFAIVMPGVSDLSVLARRVDDISEQLATPIEDPESMLRLSVSASFGVALWPQDGASPDVLQRNADLALYAAKADGVRNVHRFDAEMRRAADERHNCISDLRESLAAGDFEVFYQPLVEVVGRKLIGFEALVRWNHPRRGMLLPADFLIDAESVGLMAPIGDVVIRGACQQVNAWVGEGLDPGRIAVNLSRNHFRGSTRVAELVEIVRSAGLAPGQVEFEVTEAVTFGPRGEHVLEALLELRGQGFSIALDDFGTGYASLMHLRRLPVDTIKLDRTFISDIERSVTDRALVRTIASLGRDLGLRVVAEGIETETLAVAVAELGCECGQGYHFGAPMPAQEATAWLRALRMS